MLPPKMVKARITGLISTNSEIDFVQFLSPIRWFSAQKRNVTKEIVFSFNIKIRRLIK